MDTNTLRKKYLNFFAKKGHKIVPSSSLVPVDDPTLLFTSAGMNQFKKEFLGHVSGFRRAVTCQRCLRTDDLEKVGQTDCHHTFFEMLGNFSFGDYFKKEAISWAWEFLLEELKLKPDTLWVSVYEEDQEAYNVWKDIIGFPRERIVKLGAKDNFWPANAIIDGPNGPCGPCSEIFFDYGKDKGCRKPSCNPGCGCGRFVEIWNLVFTQFNRKDKGLLEPLPNKNIDTGMGLERIASVMQGVKSNFEIDIFKPVIKAIIANGVKSNEQSIVYAIGDHIRAVVFAVYDGVNPSNEQRGYVVRKLIRKSGFHGYTLGIKKPFLYKLVSIIAKVYSDVYPDLSKKSADIAAVILAEEKLFSSTLNTAPQILEVAFKDKAIEGSGHIAFKLHDTYGIPYEITKSWAKNKGIELNQQEFLDDLKEQRERSRKASKISDSVFAVDSVISGIKPTKFLGYEKASSSAKILKILCKGSQLKIAKEGEAVQIILNQSPFYGESGGQIGDKGVIKSKNAIFSVEDTKKQDKIIIHYGKALKGKFKPNDMVTCEVDLLSRKAIARAHTATHMLQAALRQVLGDSVRQAGSLVEADCLRFDFMYNQQVTQDELNKVERLIQEKILSAEEVHSKELTLECARKTGALAFFGEKYDEKVRVISIEGFSKEFCGGTHLCCTSEAGIFKIVSESSVAKGTRRIEAITGKLAYEKIKVEEKQLAQVSDLFKAAPDKLSEIAKSKLDELAGLQKQATGLKFDMLRQEASGLIEKARDINGVKIISHLFKDVELGLLRQCMDFLKVKLSSSYVCCLASSENNRAWLVLAVSDDIVAKHIDARALIKDLAIIINGNGGGRPNMAQAGGANVNGLESALTNFNEILGAKLNESH